MGIADDLKSLTKSATKKWTKQRTAEMRGKSRGSRRYIYSDRVHFTRVAHKILPDAYMHASGDGKYTVNKRNLYYASRQKFLELTGRKIEYPYFANTLLVKYLNQHAETASWKITADPRGKLTIPNSEYEISVPCGTIQIENHLRDEAKEIDLKLNAELPIQWPSSAAGQRYQAVLYIEKEGFDPMLKEAQIAERYDLAILSCKGQSVVAARKYVDEVCGVDRGIPLFVVHDLDKYGFEIARSLTEVSREARFNDRVTYQFRNKINVHDLGLRLADMEKYGLSSEDCKAPDFINSSLATKEEREFLMSGRRVELNDFTAPDFIKWIEEKLDEHLPNRMIPTDAVIEDAYRRAIAVAEINRAIDEARDEAIKKAEEAEIPKRLKSALRKSMKEEGEPWDAALYRLVTRAIINK